ncbi:MAG: Arc family DNA binding domain-containing protein [Sphingobacteriia bacterium]|nr:Arc family DNA binding domain-containing protein [Sphingobacteriia bacterium]
MSLTKKNFVLRINEQTYIALEKWAAEEFRSVNGQIEMLLDRALKEAGKKKDTSVTLVKQKR